MDLPRSIRYRPYQEWSKEAYQAIQQKVAQSLWRSHFHIEARTGLLNDPNGFSYFAGSFQLFYQNWPFGAAHGLKQWVHTTSTDLVHFTETKTRLLPDHQNDSHGAYSGSAYPIGDKLFLCYTGNVRSKDWVRHPLQIGAWMDQSGHITKYEQVLIDKPDDVTEHFRDPQIFTYQDQLYAIIGAQNLQNQGIIKLYKANNNDVTSWQFVADLDFDDSGTAYMIECPNLVFIEDKPVLIFCPQGIAKSELDYQNIYPNTYKVFQTFDPKRGRLLGGGPIQNLDFGFEAYATQAFNSPDGRVLAVSWIGLPDIDYPTDKYAYQGALSLVKELRLKNGRLHQAPVPALSKLRDKAQPFQNKKNSSNCYELALTIEAQQAAELLLFADTQHKGLKLTVDTCKGQLTIDRSKAGAQYAQEFGAKRSCQIPVNRATLNIYVDKSILEIFVNQGEAVLTSRVFPNEGQSGIELLKGQVSGYYYEMRY
ncbi:TPA: sucrose-6-phosphate hydrolase [Streptococcus equi subsp. zooepidemicus]|uniref:sucrose-6-phosphate hydrolase n=1 Tax=Streptococcus equi TaxID=1336 RepID=UPI00197CBF33|nr:sucrose-6-phosphate hydrolase [Streptococcus equi]QTR94479.1 Sucrose-6-phosphate hydrolase [Streptococcus equi subsp. zooepidemicus]HEL0579702.1 sucrose-6-phosphate hydrolase [Streptococcus equi subsp. zooepidemicus]HEL0731388.1 sucrose-6-phosphate hydrolase [Streptococcus equi subsp. zooepidemicus]HEL0752546.1 sucrose-6-phosphate hydrolase [Streptococcus equi subsp. zooepidemicus]HEL1030610.1 sucrose-6-phosphate hydrolase [Streptococcus equi subsp. zooepidemicus]